MNTNLKRLTRLAIFIAITILISLTPIGYLKLGPISFTILAVPVIIAGTMFGPFEGAVVGLAFGLTSFYKAPTELPLVYQYNVILTLLVCTVPRMLIGIVAGLISKAFAKIGKQGVISYSICGVIGSITNTVLFLGLLYIFFKAQLTESFASLLTTKTLGIFLIGLGLTGGIPEAIAAAILNSGVCKALYIYTKRGNL